MRKMVIVSIHDRKSRSFGTPVVADSLDMAKRNFDMMVKDPNNKMMHKYPFDFELMHLADYDEFTGKITPCESPAVILVGSPEPEPEV